MKKLVSVIIPVYNVKPYLAECIESVIGQTYTNLEIILVDDGSTDLSDKLCDYYEKKDLRIKSYHKENGGLSSARNYGLDKAKGEYIFFLDSDDYITKDCIEKLYAAIEDKDGFIGITDYQSDKIGNWEGGVKKSSLSRTDVLSWLDLTIAREYAIGVMSIGKLIPAYIMKEIRFPEGKIHEDEFVAYDIIWQSKGAAFIDEKLYYYRDREDSITGDLLKEDKRHLDILDAYEHRIEMTEANGDIKSLELVWRNCLLRIIYSISLYDSNDKELMQSLKDRYNRIYKKYFFKMPLKKKVKYFLLKP